MLDTRSYRDPRYRVDSDAAPKTMLGAAQKRWLLDLLEKSAATWKIVVSTVPEGVSVFVTVQLPDERLYEKLAALAKAKQVSVSVLAGQIITDYVKEERWRDGVPA